MFCVNVQQLIKDNYLKIVWRDNPKHEGAQQLMQEDDKDFSQYVCTGQLEV